MRTLVYFICVAIITIWTIVTVVATTWGLIEALPIIEDQFVGQYQWGLNTAAAAVVGAIMVAVIQWALIVIPFGIVAILTRPSWPVHESPRQQMGE